MSIEEQIEEVGRAIRERERYYPDSIAKKRLKPETAEKKLADLRAAQRSLMTIQKHADGLRLLISVLQRVARDERKAVTDEEAKMLLDLPEVAAIVEAFRDYERLDSRIPEAKNFDFLQQIESGSEQS